MSEFKNILITGGAGFIGSRLALNLKERGYAVTVMDNLSPQVHGRNPTTDSWLYQSIAREVHFVQGDVTNRADWNKVLKDQDAVIHLAAETGTGQSMYRIHRYAEVNISGTANLLDFLVNEEHTVRKVIVASSRAVYGEGKYLHPALGVVYPEPRNPEEMTRGDFEVKYSDGQILQAVATDEASRLHPSSIYGITKQTQEQMIMSVCGAAGIAAVALRYQNVYGEGQSLLNPYTGILSVFSNQILSGKTVDVFEDGRESRDFIYIDDAVTAAVRALESNKATYDILNVGSGIPTTVRNVAQDLVKNYGGDVEVKVSGRFRLGDIRHNFADMSRTQQVLDFASETSFSEGLRRFSAWVLSQDIKDNRLEQSLAEMKARKLLF